MQINALKTDFVQPGDSLELLLKKSISNLKDQSIVVVTSKVVSLCENRVVDVSNTSKAGLAQCEANWFIESHKDDRPQITVTKNILIRNAGIDFTDDGTKYILWPSDSQKSANDIRRFLCKSFGLENVGVIITDGASRPLRRGTTGIALAHSGFLALERYNYEGAVDEFGNRPKGYSNADRAYGLAAAAVTVMGEGDEHTPLAIIEDIPFIKFQSRDPNYEELSELYTNFESDFFSPLLKSVRWERKK